MAGVTLCITQPTLCLQGCCLRRLPCKNVQHWWILQPRIGGLGVAIVCLSFGWTHWFPALLAATLGAAVFGALWAAIPAYLQGKYGSHIVITTIMFNFIGASLLNYLLVNVMRPTGSMDPATQKFPEATSLPTLHDILEPIGISFSKAGPANISFLIALIACVLVWIFIWHTRLGYQLRAYGHSESAAKYAGIKPFKIIMISMMISGALGGDDGVQYHVMGEAERLILNSTEGAGFIGIAVALMGRSHPVGSTFSSTSLWISIPRWCRACNVDNNPPRINSSYTSASYTFYRRSRKYGEGST